MLDDDSYETDVLMKLMSLGSDEEMEGASNTAA